MYTRTQGYDLNQALNIVVAGLGFICALICLAHLLRARHTASGLARLVIYMEIWLFVFNSIYASAFFAYALGTNVYTRRHGLIRAYSLNEYDADPRFFMLKSWARLNAHAIFWIQLIGLLPSLWHLVRTGGLGWWFVFVFGFWGLLGFGFGSFPHLHNLTCARSSPSSPPFPPLLSTYRCWPGSSTNFS